MLGTGALPLAGFRCQPVQLEGTRRLPADEPLAPVALRLLDSGHVRSLQQQRHASHGQPTPEQAHVCTLFCMSAALTAAFHPH